MTKKNRIEIYIENTKLNGSRGIKRCRTLIFKRCSYREAIKRCQQQSDLDGSRSYPVAIKEIEIFSMN